MGKKQPRLFFEFTFKLSSREIERMIMMDMRQAAKKHIEAFANDFPKVRRQRVLFALLKFFRSWMRKATKKQLRKDLKELQAKLSSDEILIFNECLYRVLGPGPDTDRAP
jgi:hypothetical protein